MKILTVAGARPNFMKIAPLHRAFMHYPEIQSRIVHTGQHYDYHMSGVFFEQLGLPEPDHFLGIGSGSCTSQTAGIMLAFERVLKVEKPDLTVVVGDVTSTAACALVAAQMHIPLAHVEAGLRSGDRAMPEEINRMLTDAVSDQLFATEQAAVDNLLLENIGRDRIHLVGNVMIDSLLRFCDRSADRNLLRHLNVRENEYLLVTMHRPSNVDHADGIRMIAQTLRLLAALRPVVFVVHPRTMDNIRRFGLDHAFKCSNLIVQEPLGYLEFLTLMRHCCAVVTDSGGVQEETTFLGIPCMTLRNNTERPVTVESGTNYLVPDYAPAMVAELVGDILNGNAKKGSVPPLWDGNAAERIAEILREKYINS